MVRRSAKPRGKRRSPAAIAPSTWISVGSPPGSRNIIARSGSNRATGIGSSPAVVCRLPVSGSMPVATCPSPSEGESM